MKQPCAAFLTALLLASCSPFDGKTKPLDAAMTQTLAGLTAAARTLGWAEAAAPAATPLAEGPLGYRILRFDGGKTGDDFVWSKEELDKVQAEAASRGTSTATAPVVHARPALDRPSPLPAEAASWTKAQLTEWLAWEWAAARWGAGTPALESRVSQAAFRFTETLLTKTEGPGSADLVRWRDSVRDRRTFQELAADLRAQVRGVIAAHQDPGERNEILHRIEAAWFSQYTAQYPNRFLTNDYRDFGAEGWVEPADLELIGTDTLAWTPAADRPFADAPSLWKALEGGRP